ncbi:L-lactate permease [Lactiplantibacillus plantarum]|nr:L-lactate permease [Lactiplantibacillus plantarum]
MIFIASAAIILPLILLGGLNLSATRGMTISALVVIITGYFFWQISPMDLIWRLTHAQLFACHWCNRPD